MKRPRTAIDLDQCPGSPSSRQRVGPESTCLLLDPMGDMKPGATQCSLTETRERETDPQPGAQRETGDWGEKGLRLSPCSQRKTNPDKFQTPNISENDAKVKDSNVIVDNVGNIVDITVTVIRPTEDEDKQGPAPVLDQEDDDCEGLHSPVLDQEDDSGKLNFPIFSFSKRNKVSFDQKNPIYSRVTDQTHTHTSTSRPRVKKLSIKKMMLLSAKQKTEKKPDNVLDLDNHFFEANNSAQAQKFPTTRTENYQDVIAAESPRTLVGTEIIPPGLGQSKFSEILIVTGSQQNNLLTIQLLTLITIH